MYIYVYIHVGTVRNAGSLQIRKGTQFLLSHVQAYAPVEPVGAYVSNHLTCLFGCCTIYCKLGVQLSVAMDRSFDLLL